MHEHATTDSTRRHGGHGLMPLVVLAATVAMVRHLGRHHRMTGPGGTGRRVPPRFRSMLDAWHAEAHAGSTATSAESAPEAPTA